MKDKIAKIFFAFLSMRLATNPHCQDNKSENVAELRENVLIKFNVFANFIFLIFVNFILFL